MPEQRLARTREGYAGYVYEPVKEIALRPWMHAEGKRVFGALWDEPEPVKQPEPQALRAVDPELGISLRFIQSFVRLAKFNTKLNRAYDDKLMD